MRTPLAEFRPSTPHAGLRPKLAAGPPPAKQLEDALFNDSVQRYQAVADRANRDLGGDGFELRAQWKRKELRREARLKAQALRRSYANEHERIAAAHPTNKRDRERAWSQFTKRKLEEYDELAQAEADGTARADMLVQSGVVDAEKSKVMTWVLGGSNTCPICLAVAAGNPYTIQRATTLGQKLHPGCKDQWQNEWETDPALVKETKRKVADGELQMWDGGGRTPARSSARRLQSMMQPAKGGWKGRRTQQRRAAAAAGISGKQLEQQFREYRSG